MRIICLIFLTCLLCYPVGFALGQTTPTKPDTPTEEGTATPPAGATVPADAPIEIVTAKKNKGTTASSTTKTTGTTTTTKFNRNELLKGKIWTCTAKHIWDDLHPRKPSRPTTPWASSNAFKSWTEEVGTADQSGMVKLRKDVIDYMLNSKSGGDNTPLNVAKAIVATVGKNELFIKLEKDKLHKALEGIVGSFPDENVAPETQVATAVVVSGALEESSYKTIKDKLSYLSKEIHALQSRVKTLKQDSTELLRVKKQLTDGQQPDVNWYWIAFAGLIGAVSGAFVVGIIRLLRHQRHTNALSNNQQGQFNNMASPSNDVQSVETQLRDKETENAGLLNQIDKLTWKLNSSEKNVQSLGKKLRDKENGSESSRSQNNKGGQNTKAKQKSLEDKVHALEEQLRGEEKDNSNLRSQIELKEELSESEAQALTLKEQLNLVSLATSSGFKVNTPTSNSNSIVSYAADVEGGILDNNRFKSDYDSRYSLRIYRNSIDDEDAEFELNTTGSQKNLLEYESRLPVLREYFDIDPIGAGATTLMNDVSGKGKLKRQGDIWKVFTKAKLQVR